MSRTIKQFRPSFTAPQINHLLGLLSIQTDSTSKAILNKLAVFKTKIALGEKEGIAVAPRLSLEEKLGLGLAPKESARESTSIPTQLVQLAPQLVSKEEELEQYINQYCEGIVELTEEEYSRAKELELELHKINIVFL